MKNLYTMIIALVFCGAIFGQQVEPFSAGEGLAIEIYETALPILEDAEVLFEQEKDVTFENIAAVAEEADIELELIREAILSDPFMAKYALSELRNYAELNRIEARNVDDKEAADAFSAAALWAERQAEVFEILIEEWVPNAFNEEEE